MKLAAVLVGAALVAACGGSDEAAEPPLIPTTTTVADPAPEWSPACRPATAPAGRAVEADRFGPLAEEAAVVVHLPVPRGDRFPQVRPAAVEGGIALGIAPGSSGTARSSMVAVVDDDGTGRWVRCVDGVLEGVWAGGGTVLVASWVGDRAQPRSEHWTAFAAEDGAEQELPAAIDDNLPMVFGGGDTVLVGEGEVGFERTLALLRVGSAELEPVEVRRDEAMWRCRPHYEVDDGRLLANGPEHAVLAEWRDGAWRDGPDVPLRAAFSCQGQELRGVEGSGRVRWARPDLVHPGLEGLPLVQDGEVAVAIVCGERSAEHQCPLGLVAVDVASGRTLWSRTGQHSLVAADDGYVLVGADGGWALRDVRTGEAVPGQAWSGGAFTQGCCGDAEHLHVHRFGGWIVAVDGLVARIWYPRGATGEPAELSVPQEDR